MLGTLLDIIKQSRQGNTANKTLRYDSGRTIEHENDLVDKKFISEMVGTGDIRANLIGVKDGVNVSFTLPPEVDVTSKYELEYNGVGLKEVLDFAVDEQNPHALTMVDAPDSYDRLDVIYSSGSNSESSSSGNIYYPIGSE